MTTRDGVIAGGSALNATGAGAMQVQIAVGRALVQGTEAQGAYPVAVTAPETLTVTDGNATNPRIDVVVLRVCDELYDTTGQTLARVELVTGAASATPTPPTLPPTSLRLWEITVPAGVSAGTGGITWSSALADRRRYTAAYGGITPVVGACRSPVPTRASTGTTDRASIGGTARRGRPSTRSSAGHPSPSRRATPTTATPKGPSGTGGSCTAACHTSSYGAASLGRRPARCRTAGTCSPPYSPANCRPVALTSLPIAAGGVDIKLDAQTSGQLRLISSTGLTTWAAFGGVQYPLDA